jgi:hypothetical protein
MGQQGGRIEIQNIMDGLLFDLPRLLEAANQVAALYNLQKAQARRKKREAVADRIDKLSEELLEETFVAAKESQARGAQEVEALREKATAIAELLKKGKEIDRNNRSLRKQAVASLGEIQTAFNQALEEVGTADTLR